jgi:Arc/MetJ-type ribon-helix-helix transcriptional regulator
MSDMASHRITVRIPAPLSARLQEHSRDDGRSPSDVVRTALEKYLVKRAKPRSAYDAAKAAGVIGCARGGPKDLSTNPRYFEGFGSGK